MPQPVTGTTYQAVLVAILISTEAYCGSSVLPMLHFRSRNWRAQQLRNEKCHHHRPLLAEEPALFKAITVCLELALLNLGRNQLIHTHGPKTYKSSNNTPLLAVRFTKRTETYSRTVFAPKRERN